MRAAPGTPVAQLFRQPPFPFPFDSMSSNHYVETNELIQPIKDSATFCVTEAMAEFVPSHNYFAVKRKPEDAEIKIDDLPPKVKALFTGRGGSREKEWQNMVQQIKKEGGPAVKIHRGAQARRIREKFPHRIIPTRWLDKWKDLGDDYVIPLTAKEFKSATFQTTLELSPVGS